MGVGEMSETPETDAASFDYDAQCEYWVDAEFARKLERERDALKKQLSEIEKYGVEEINTAVELRSKLAAALVERDEAVKELESVKEELVAARSLLGEVASSLRDGQRNNVF
jgi:hypothetical protein